MNVWAVLMAVIVVVHCIIVQCGVVYGACVIDVGQGVKSRVICGLSNVGIAHCTE